MTTEPPATAPEPRTVNGSEPRPPSSMSTPSPRRAVSTSPTGRLRRWASPSNETAPVDRPATGGTNRRTVPARPQSTWASERSSPGVTDQSSPVVSTGEPSAVRASAIRVVSRERKAPRTTEGASAIAASTSARLVTDLLPGSDTSTSTGPVTGGAGHGSASRVVVTPEGYPPGITAAGRPPAWPRGGRWPSGGRLLGVRRGPRGGCARRLPAGPRCRRRRAGGHPASRGS